MEPLTQEQLLNNLHTEFANLAHRHITVSYLLIGILALVVSAAGVGGYLGLRAYDAQLARADAQQAVYIADRTAWQMALNEHDHQREAAEAQVASLEAQIAKRQVQPIPAPVKAGLAPDANAKEAAEALKTVYNGSVVPEATPEGKVSTTVTETQLLIGSKLKLDTVSANLADEIKIAGLQKSSIDTLQTDLNSCKNINIEANKTIDAYKKAATRGKLRRFFDSAVKYAGPVVGVIIGYSIHR